MGTTTNKQICSIRIMFPVDTDEQGIDIKKKISEILIEKSDAQIQFSLANLPTKPPLG